MYNKNDFELISVILKGIRNELDKYLKLNRRDYRENDTPFDAYADESFSNDVFSVNPYYWGYETEKSDIPNFKYKDFEVFWIKDVDKVVKINGNIDFDFLSQMYNECKNSLRKGA